MLVRNDGWKGSYLEELRIGCALVANRLQSLCGSVFNKLLALLAH
jgi:hypothetical protein